MEPTTFAALALLSPVIPGAPQHAVMRCGPGISRQENRHKIPDRRSGTPRRSASGTTGKRAGR